MSSSKNGTCPAPTPNGLQSLLQNEIADSDQSEKLEREWLKVRMANHVRLVQDNQRVLDTSVAEDRAVRQQRHRMREHQMNQMGVPGSTSLKFPEDDMAISIDSPVSTNHYYPPQPVTRSGVAPWIATGLATVIAAGLGGSYLGSLLNRPTPTAPVNTRTESHEGFILELVPGNGAKP